MDSADYRKVLNARRGKTGAAADSADWNVTTTEIQLTTDGEEDYSYAGGDFGTERRGEGEGQGPPQACGDQLVGGLHGALPMSRSDQRKVGDLWVIHSIGNKRPQLETYKYDMPGEVNVDASRRCWCTTSPRGG